MRKTGILNPELTAVLTGLGHTQQIAVCDAGTPIPEGTRVIDLSLLPGIPSMEQVFTAVAAELCTEGYCYAAESEEKNPAFVALLKKALPGQPAEVISHEEYKKRLSGVKAVVRTGECSPYANVLLTAGVTF